MRALKPNYTFKLLRLLNASLQNPPAVNFIRGADAKFRSGQRRRGHGLSFGIQRGIVDRNYFWKRTRLLLSSLAAGGVLLRAPETCEMMKRGLVVSL